MCAPLTTHCNCIAMGDFNIGVVSRLYTESLTLNGIGILNKFNSKFATRISDASFTLIDHVISDKFDFSYEMLIDHIPDFSDHKYILHTFYIETGQLRNSSQKSEIFKHILDYCAIENDEFWSKCDKIEFFEKLIKKLKTLIENNRKIKIINTNMNLISTMGKQ